MDNSIHSGIIDATEHDVSITLVGCGAIGSSVGELIARMGFDRINLIDFDKVEEHNLANQLYNYDDIGKTKVQALKEKIKRINPHAEVDAMVGKIEDTTKDIPGNIIMMCTDNMKARKDTFNIFKAQKIDFFIDGRMGGLLYHVYCVNSHNQGDIKHYEDSLFTDAEATQMRCSVRGIIYNTFGVGADMVNGLKKYLMLENYHREIVFDYSSGNRLNSNGYSSEEN